MNNLEINVDKKHPNLPNAPIVEAVVHWQAAPQVSLEEESLQKELVSSFGDYIAGPKFNQQIGLRNVPDLLEVQQERIWQGVRLSSPDDKQPKFVCQFMKNGIAFSRLSPYEGWNRFVDEAMRFWQKYVELGQPSSVSQLSVRYISQIAVQSSMNVSEYIQQVYAPLSGMNLEADHFFHQDSIQLKNQPYRINVIRAVQPATDRTNNLIVDISVSTTSVLEDLGTIDDKLRELRFIKNEVFFTLMNDAETKFGAK